MTTLNFERLFIIFQSFDDYVCLIGIPFCTFCYRPHFSSSPRLFLKKNLHLFILATQACTNLLHCQDQD